MEEEDGGRAVGEGVQVVEGGEGEGGGVYDEGDGGVGEWHRLFFFFFFVFFFLLFCLGRGLERGRGRVRWMSLFLVNVRIDGYNYWGAFSPKSICSTIG